MKGVICKSESYAYHGKLTNVEEKKLRECMNGMINLELVPQKLQIRIIANVILAGRGETPSVTVGSKWVDNFIARSKDHKRLLAEDSRKMAEWLSVVKCAIEEYGIVPEEICNVDKTGFAMGQMQYDSIKELLRHQVITDQLFSSENASHSIKSSERAFVKLARSVKENGDLLKANGDLQNWKAKSGNIVDNGR